MVNPRFGLTGSAAVALLLTGCPLTDDYHLVSERAPQAGASGDGAGGLAPAGSYSGGSEANGLPGGGTSAADQPSVDGGGGSTDLGGRAGSVGLDACQNTCSASQTCCGTKCVDSRTDDAHCGECGKGCNAGRTCAASTCSAGWLAMSSAPMPFVGRSKAAAVAMGAKVFIWGGISVDNEALGDGAIYDPRVNTWQSLPSTTGSPSARMLASAVWTGTVVVVFGGTDTLGKTAYRDGGFYDPSADSWTAIDSPSSVVRRGAPYAFWDGTTAFFWGGTTAAGILSWIDTGIGERLSASGWAVSSGANDPGALAYPAVAYTGSTMLLSGGILGNNRQDKSWSYDVTNNKWAQLPGGGPSSRSSSFGAWDGSRFVVWGGRDDNGLRNDGRYLLGSAWTTLSSNGAPTARMITYRRSGWAFQVKPGIVAMMGGQISLSGQGALATNGAFYDLPNARWAGIPDWPTQEAHEFGVGVWTGEEFIVWGGRNPNGASSTGQRWAPP